MKRALFLAAIAALAGGCIRSHTADPLAHQTPYHYPLNSIGAKFSGLPPAVQNTVRSEVGVAEISDIIRETLPDHAVYKIYFRYADLFPPLFIAPDGSVLNPDYTVAVSAPQEFIGVSTRGPLIGLKPSDLPPAVMKTIQERAPTSEIGIIDKQTWDDQDVYIISFKDPAHNPKLYIGSDGSVVKIP